jgi:hypothetical protein
VSAADAREELEAAVRLAITRNGKCKADGRCTGCESNIDDALNAADAYAAAVADERIAGRVHDRVIGRERLADLNAAVRGVTR